MSLNDDPGRYTVARITNRAVIFGVAAGVLGVSSVYVYTLPGLRRLPEAGQRSLDGIVTIDDAVRHLQRSGETGWELVAAAQALVNAKMEYSRRNGWDTASRAFSRGMGYCQQQAMALMLILRKLGVPARPVQALRCRFPPARVHEYWDPGGISGHTWLVVSIDDVEKDVCPGHPDNTPGNVHFEVLSRKTPYGPVKRLLGHVGSMLLNVHRDNVALQKPQNRASHVKLGATGTQTPPSRQVVGERSIAVKTSDTEVPTTSLSRKDRALLLLEQEGNKRLRGLGTVMYRLTRGRFTPRNRDVLLLTTRGRKTGREHTVLLQAFPDGENMVLVAANSGRSSRPDWYHNLMAAPTARVEIMDRIMRVRAEELSDAEAETLWPRILRHAPSYARYRKAAGRAIPLVRLVPVEPGQERDGHEVY